MQIQILLTKVGGPQNRKHAFALMSHTRCSTIFYCFHSFQGISIHVAYATGQHDNMHAFTLMYLKRCSTTVCHSRLWSPASMWLMLLFRKNNLEKITCFSYIWCLAFAPLVICIKIKCWLFAGETSTIRLFPGSASAKLSNYLLSTVRTLSTNSRATSINLVFLNSFVLHTKLHQLIHSAFCFRWPQIRLDCFHRGEMSHRCCWHY